MSRRTTSAALIVAALATTPTAAQPGGGVRSPGPFPVFAQYSLDGSPANQTDPNPQNYLFFPFTDVSQLTYNWWFYRVAGDTMQRPFGAYLKSDGFNITGTSSWPPGGSSNTASYQWTEF